MVGIHTVLASMLIKPKCRYIFKTIKMRLLYTGKSLWTVINYKTKCVGKDIP